MLKLCKRWRAYGCMMENIWMHSNAMRSCEFKRINGKRSVILHSVKTRCITDNIIVQSFGDSAVTNAERRTPRIAGKRREAPAIIMGVGTDITVSPSYVPCPQGT